MAKGIEPEESMAALFGSRVRRLRTAAGLTQAQLGAKTHVVSTRITQVERASGARPTLELARALDAALGADGLLVDLWPHVYRESFPDWSRTFMAYSAQAAAIREYTGHVVPGLLQTEEYARAVLSVGLSHRDKEHLEERLTARLERQKRLDPPDPRNCWRSSTRRCCASGSAGTTSCDASSRVCWKPPPSRTSPYWSCRSTRARTTCWAVR